MASFKEVCKQALRMAEAESKKDGCRPKYVALYIAVDGTYALSGGGTAVTAEELEKTIMKWAAEHPEPKYPSWIEAWKQAFPDVDTENPPCPRYFMCKEKSERICDLHDNCFDCKNSPIPADVAKALNVKAIERRENK